MDPATEQDRRPHGVLRPARRSRRRSRRGGTHQHRQCPCRDEEVTPYRARGAGRVDECGQQCAAGPSPAPAGRASHAATPCDERCDGRVWAHAAHHAGCGSGGIAPARHSGRRTDPPTTHGPNKKRRLPVPAPEEALSRPGTSGSPAADGAQINAYQALLPRRSLRGVLGIHTCRAGLGHQGDHAPLRGKGTTRSAQPYARQGSRWTPTTAAAATREAGDPREPVRGRRRRPPYEALAGPPDVQRQGRRHRLLLRRRHSFLTR